MSGAGGGFVYAALIITRICPACPFALRVPAQGSGNVDYLPLAAIPPGYGYISGSVYNSTWIPGVLVTTHTSNSTKSDASGFYYLLVPAGAYNLTSMREPVFYPNSSVIVSAISGTTVAQDIELFKKPTGTISGTVTSV